MASDPAGGGAGLTTRAVPWVIAAFVVLAFAIQTAHPLNADTSWLFTAAERLLAGETLYTDIYEVNPPMSVLLYVPWVWLGQITHVSAELVTIAVALLASVLATALGARILARSTLSFEPTTWWLIALPSLTVLPGINFSEREHFAVIFILPVLALSAVRGAGMLPSWSHRLMGGLLGGLVMTIKPHFALAILLPALYGAVHARSWRPIFNVENVISGLILVGFWLLVWLAFPAFFTVMLPLSEAIYLPDRAPLVLLAIVPGMWLVWFMAAILFTIYRREVLRLPEVTFVAGAAGFLLCYVIQGKGFGYHVTPTIILLAIVLATIFVRRNVAGRAPRFTLLAAVAGGIFLLVPVIETLRGNTTTSELQAIVAPYGPGLKLANISQNLGFISPLQRAVDGTIVTRAAYRMIALGALRLQYRNGDGPESAKWAAFAAQDREMLRDDLEKNPPDIIVTGGDAFDWLGWARQDPAIDRLLQDYQPIGAARQDDRPISVLKRNDLALPESAH
ncbi:MAG TPA: hypothetical protein VGM83_01680 [Devosiaceae bacterium]|jgi:hypothetical protein